MVNTICLPISHILIIFCVFLGFTVLYNEKNKSENTPNLDIKVIDERINNAIKNKSGDTPNMDIKTIDERINNAIKNKSGDTPNMDIKVIDERINNAIKNNIRQPKEIVIIRDTQTRPDIRENMSSRNNKDDDELERREFLRRRDAGVITNVLHPPERRVPEHNYPFNFVKAQLNIPTRGLPDNFHQLGVVLRDDTETGYNLFGRQKFPGSSQYEYYVTGNMGFNNVKLPIKIKGDKEVEDGQIIEIPGTKKENGNFKVKLYDYDTPRYNPHVF